MQDNNSLPGAFHNRGDMYEVVMERIYNHPAAALWQAISDPEQMRLWLGRTEMEAEPGGRITIHLDNGPHRGMITRLQPGKLLEYSWGPEVMPGEVSVVTWEVVALSATQSKLVLTHKYVGKAYRALTAASWNIFTALIGSVLDNNKQQSGWPKAQWEAVHKAYDQALQEDAAQEDRVKPEAIAGMLIRKPVTEVYEAMVDPAITTQFWFSKSSGRWEAGKIVTLEWEAYGASAPIIIKEAVPGKHIWFQWPGPGGYTQVHISFTAVKDGAFIEVRESGWKEEGAKTVQLIVGQTEGWTLVLTGMKAWLEQGIRLHLVTDRFPKDLPAS